MSRNRELKIITKKNIESFLRTQGELVAPRSPLNLLLNEIRENNQKVVEGNSAKSSAASILFGAIDKEEAGQHVIALMQVQEKALSEEAESAEEKSYLSALQALLYRELPKKDRSEAPMERFAAASNLSPRSLLPLPPLVPFSAETTQLMIQNMFTAASSKTLLKKETPPCQLVNILGLGNSASKEFWMIRLKAATSLNIPIVNQTKASGSMGIKSEMMKQTQSIVFDKIGFSNSDTYVLALGEGMNSEFYEIPNYQFYKSAINDITKLLCLELDIPAPKFLNAGSHSNRSTASDAAPAPSSHISQASSATSLLAKSDLSPDLG